jgi:predicted translin family RNA/ssDNA-binding protein
MINKKFIKKLKESYNKHESERRQIISLSNAVLHDSKRIIFALHREDFKKAEESLAEIEKTIKILDSKFGHSRLSEEGAFKAAMEEFAEAKLFYLVARGEKIDEFEKINLDVDSYIGGICDLTGELVRRAVNLASKGKLKEVEKVKDIINDIMAELVEFDMTGYLRTKYDQAKTNLRKIEQISYEIKIRK